MAGKSLVPGAHVATFIGSFTVSRYRTTAQHYADDQSRGTRVKSKLRDAQHCSTDKHLGRGYHL